MIESAFSAVPAIGGGHAGETLWTQGQPRLDLLTRPWPPVGYC